MKKCPQCNRVYNDETLNYCLDDGEELIYGPSLADPDTAVLTSEAPTRIHTTDRPISDSALRIGPAYSGKLWLLVLIPVIAAVAYFGYRYTSTSPVKQIESVAVLPIVNETANPDIEYLSDGLTESLISSLSQLPRLSVKARSSVFRYKGTDVDIKKAGRDLGVEALLTGRMAQRGQDVRVDIELVEASTEKVLWKADYHRSMADLAALENDLTRDIAGQLRSKLTGTGTPSSSGIHTENADAYEAYLKGQYFADGSEDETIKAIGYYNQAIAADPNYALAYVGLAGAYMHLGGVLGFMHPRETYPKANEALKKALAINPDLAQVHGALASYELLYNWDWQAAKREYDIGLSIDPDYSELHNSYGTYLESIGRYEEAVRERDLARKLDPLSAVTTADVGYPLYYARRQQEAIDNFRRGTDLDQKAPWPHLWIGQSLLELKQFPEAMAEIDKAVELSGGSSIRILATRGYAYAISGRRDDALKVISDLKTLSRQKYVSPYFYAVIYSGLGEKDEAFDYLNQAIEERHPYLILTNVEPVFDNLRSDLRFAAVIDRIGIPR